MGAPLSIAIDRALANPVPALVEVSRIRCERSLAEFVRSAWHIVEPGTPLVWNWHLDVICAYTQAFYDGRIKRLIINVPPGSMKSLIFSVLGPAHRWAVNPSERVINLTNELGLAKRDTRRMRDVVQSEWYRERWGHRFALSHDQDTTTHFENTEKGFRQALGLGANITGKRGSRLAIDDPVDAKKAFSDNVIAEANLVYDTAVSTRLNNPEQDCIGIIMQRLRTNDLTGHVRAKKRTQWTLVSIPMEYEGAPGYDPVADLGPDYAHLADPRTRLGELMFPQRFTPRVVAALKEDLGEYGSAGQLQQRPTPLSGGILKAPWWQVWPKDRKLPKILHAFASWDTAFSERDLKDSAYSACLVWGVWRDETDCGPGHEEGRHKLLLLSAWYERTDIDGLLDRAKEIEKSKLSHAGDAHLIERKASGISLIQQLRRRTKVRVLGYEPGPDGGGDKVARAYNVAPLFRAGVVWVPDREWAHQVVQAIAQFPAGDALSKDLTDCATQAVSYLSKGWWIRHPDDEIASPVLASDDDDLESGQRRGTAGTGYGG